MKLHSGGVGGAFVVAAVAAVARDRRCPAPPEDDDTWLASARAQGVLGVVVDAIERAGHPARRALVERARLLGPAIQLQALADLRPLARALDATGARWAVLKGPVLGAVAYRRRGVRTYGDLDVLVHPSDFASVLDQLVPDHAELVHRNWSHFARTADGEIGLRLSGGTRLDLHWHVVNRAERRRDLGVSIPSLLASRQQVDLDGVSAWSLAPVDVVLHTALHGCLSGAHSLKWLLDLHQALLWADADPAELRERAEETGLTLPLAVMLERTARYLDPAVEPWAAPLPRASWPRLTAVASRWFPPGASTYRLRSGATVFASTRRTSTASIRCLLRQAARNRLYTWRLAQPADGQARQAAQGGERERQQWLAHVAQHG